MGWREHGEEEGRGQNYLGDYTLCVRSVGGMERAWGRGGEEVQELVGACPSLTHI